MSDICNRLCYFPTVRKRLHQGYFSMHFSDIDIEAIYVYDIVIYAYSVVDYTTVDEFSKHTSKVCPSVSSPDTNPSHLFQKLSVLLSAGLPVFSLPSLMCHQLYSPHYIIPNQKETYSNRLYYK